MENKTIIIGDFSGIQNYLFDIKKNKSATKRLKGRSVFIEMLLEKIKENLKSYKEKIADFEEKDYLISGGKFILIGENFDIEKFRKFQKEIEKKLFKEFYGELKIIFGISEWNGEEGNFKKALNKAYEDVEKNKLRAFENIFIKNGEWNEEKFVFEDDRGTDKVCKFSRDRLIDEKMTKIIEKEIGKDFFDENDKGISYEAGIDLLITKGIIKGEFIDNKENGENNKFELEIDKLLNNEILKKGIPVFNEEEIKIHKNSFEDLKNIKKDDVKTFEVLATKIIEDKEGNKKLNKGFNKLAVLKGDIDNLGEIFQFGLKDFETSSEGQNYQKNYKELSEILENFWKKELYDFIDNNKEYKNKLYVVYAGGDDFVILGKWDIIIKFYADLLKEFEEKISKNEKVIKLLKNDYLKEVKEDSEINSEGQKEKIADIHFSGAINLFGPHDTFFTVVKNTEKLLEKAKEGNKNKVNIFGQVLENKDFKQILEEAEKFINEFLGDSETSSEGQEKNIVSTGTLRFLLDIGRKIKLEKNAGKDEDGNQKDFFEYGTWKSELFYHLGRNYKTKKGNDKKDKFRNYIDGMLLINEIKKFESLLEGNEKLFNENTGEKLIVMMSYILYKMRDK